ncbi:PQQ-dependent sugar dehydrogenase [Aquipuribacter nitratireducens]|uniref:PQQ-dependent sugar dehydrogenase n=1 Tax=Aquipuribacter nitratireducens TaxID=650104 RepID=A0ABW0GQ49_9MICO
MTTTPLRVGVTAVAAGALVLSLGASAPAVTTVAPLHSGHVADADLPPDSAFDKVTIDRTPGEPLDLAVLPDLRVLHVTRAGEVRLHDPVSGLTTTAAELDVYLHDEEGLQSVAIDPDFATNNWVYLYYSPVLDTPLDDPLTPNVNEGDAPAFGEPEDFEPYEGYLQLSRFKLVGDELDLSTEEKIMQVPVDRGICCHVGGDIVFDADGNLYLSTGDDTNPFSSGGYTPIDEREDRNPAYDAQRTSANTNDLGGKILRITPTDGGGYTIPEGNMFAPGTEGTRPEIFAMGFRNPFRIELDQETGLLFVGDYSPDARFANPERGPGGTGRWMVVEGGENFGWPYCVDPTTPYVDYDFATGESGEPFDCAAPVNESPNNTGLVQLPPVADSELEYQFGASAEFPELGTGGIGPMAGDVYRGVEPGVRGLMKGRPSVAWPEEYIGHPLFGEWTRDYVKMFTLDEDADEIVEIDSVLPSLVFDNPMDMEFGPDGALYVLEYGDGYFRQNPDAQLSRFDFIGQGGNRSPQPVIEADPVTGSEAPLTVDFAGTGSSDPEGDRLKYAWDFDSDGTVDSTSATASFTYEEPGYYRASLQVTDVGGKDRKRSASTYVEISVGGQAPVVDFVTPGNGDTFSWGDTISYEVTVSDDQPVDCDAVTVTYIVGHDQHGHPITTASGCTGTIQTSLPQGHDPEVDEISAVFVASYTDPGAGAIPPQTGTDQVRLVPVG